MRRTSVRAARCAGDTRGEAVLSRLTSDDLKLAELAGQPVTAVLTTAPGDGRPIGGIKVVAVDGWSAARPSGTEAVYKLYAESFRRPEPLRRIQDEAQTVIAHVLRPSTKPHG